MLRINLEENKELSCTSSEGIVDGLLISSCVSSSAPLIDLCEERRRWPIYIISLKLDDNDDSKLCNLPI